MLTPAILESRLKDLKPVLTDKYFVNRIGYFGSFATGNETENSDIDILVEFSQPLGWEFFDLNDLLEHKLERKVDLVSVKALRPELKNAILKQVKYV